MRSDTEQYSILIEPYHRVNTVRPGLYQHQQSWNRLMSMKLCAYFSWKVQPFLSKFMCICLVFEKKYTFKRLNHCVECSLHAIRLLCIWQCTAISSLSFEICAGVRSRHKRSIIIYRDWIRYNRTIYRLWSSFVRLFYFFSFFSLYY